MTAHSGDLPRTAAPADPADELSLLDVVTPLVRRWKALVAVPLGAALLTLALALVWPTSYTAQVTFTPEQASTGLSNALNSLGGPLGGLAGGLAGQINLPSSLSSGPSADFFGGVLESRELLEATLLSEFAVPADSARRRHLVELMKPRGATPARRLGNARRKLTERTRITVDRKTGIVTLDVTLPDARLAADVANRMTQLLNAFNLDRRQTSSRQQRRFAEERLAAARGELRRAEQGQLGFLQANRDFSLSPELSYRYSQLDREVRQRQDLVTSLTRAYEEARIAEVRDTPLLTVVDHAAPPDRAASPRPVLWTAVAGSLGLLATVVWASLAGFRERERVRAVARPDVQRMVDVVAQARADVRSLTGRS